MKTTLALLAVLSVAPCLAQDPAKGSDRPFMLAAGEIKLTELIDRCANHLGYNILRNQAELLHSSSRPGPASVLLQQPITTGKEGCEDFLTSMLWSQGFALIETDPTNGTREVIALNGPRARDISASAKACTVEQILARPGLKAPVTTTFTLKHTNAMVVVNSLRPFLASTGSPASTITLGASGMSTVLLTGIQDQVAQAIGMLQSADVPPPAVAPGAAAPLVERLVRRVEELEKRIAALEQQLAAPKAK